MMEAERASETLECSSILTRLVAREDFIEVNIAVRLVPYEHTNALLWTRPEQVLFVTLVQ
jgi:hypothetical protein